MHIAEISFGKGTGAIQDPPEGVYINECLRGEKENNREDISEESVNI